MREQRQVPLTPWRPYAWETDMLEWLTRRSDTPSPTRLALDELRKRARVLVIDDDVNAFPVEILRSEGYNIEHWPEVKSLAKLENAEYDIIVLDIGGIAPKLSDQDGFGVLEHLKAVNPLQIIVAFSGQSFDIRKTRFFKMADDVLGKPADPLKCKQVLDQLLETKFTFEYLWQAVTRVLKSSAVPEWKIRRLEKDIRRAILSRSTPDFGALASQVVTKADQVTKTTALLAKIIGLFSA